MFATPIASLWKHRAFHGKLYAHINRSSSSTASRTSSSTRKSEHRPISPHLSIYKPQLTWIMSITHRFTGAGLAAMVYGFGSYYAIFQPVQLTAHLVDHIAALPTALVFTGKLGLSMPFFYHLYNGIRHMIWDAGYALDLKAVYLGGWTVNVLTILSSLASAMIH